MSVDEDEFGYVLHNLVTREDISTYTESEALVRTQGFTKDQDWALWKLRRDGTGESLMIGVGRGPVTGGCIKLHRGRAHLLDVATPFKVVIDGAVVGKILTNETQSFDVTTGNHRLHIRYLWLRRSKDVEVFVKPGEQEEFTCRTAWWGDLALTST